MTGAAKSWTAAYCTTWAAGAFALESRLSLRAACWAVNGLPRFGMPTRILTHCQAATRCSPVVAPHPSVETTWGSPGLRTARCLDQVPLSPAQPQLALGRHQERAWRRQELSFQFYQRSAAWTSESLRSCYHWFWVP